MKYNNRTLFSGVTMNTNLASTAEAIPDIYGYCIQAVFTGTPTGTFKLQASNDAFKQVTPSTPQVPVNWTDIANSSVDVTAAGDYTWNVIGAFYPFVRLVYTDTSGGTSTAVLTATINIKG